MRRPEVCLTKCQTTSMSARYVGTPTSGDLNACAKCQSLIELCGLLRPPLHAYVCSLGLSQDRAEDVIQETFLRLVRHSGQYGVRENLRAWTFRVARNISVDSHRCEKRWSRGNEPDTILRTRVDPAPNPEQKFLLEERMRRFEYACAQLTPKQRDCVFLRAEGLRYREIALILGVSVQRVGEMMQRAICLLGSSKLTPHWERT